MTWEFLIRKWFDRLIPDAPAWTVEIIGDTFLDDRLNVSHQICYRNVTFRYRTSAAPNDLDAAHEVCHVLLSRLDTFCHDLLDTKEATALERRCYKAADEEAVEDMARAFLKAYGEAA